jgi:hypothetical protein
MANRMIFVSRLLFGPATLTVAVFSMIFSNMLAHAVVTVSAFPVAVELDGLAPDELVNLVSFLSHSAV